MPIASVYASSEFIRYFFKALTIIKNSATIKTIDSTNAIEIHNGEVTHHHDQLATGPISASLSIRNTIKTAPEREIPVDVDFEFAIVCIF